jgi:hypothetical protein
LAYPNDVRDKRRKRKVISHLASKAKNVETDDEISRLLKTLSESFDVAQDERRGFEIVDEFPFMLRGSRSIPNHFSVTCYAREKDEMPRE